MINFFNSVNQLADTRCSFCNKNYVRDGKTYKLDVWDTAGQEKI